MAKNKDVNQNKSQLEKASLDLTHWIGTTQSLIFHTIFFVFTLSLAFLGFGTDKILLVLTTAVSLEAIYLSIFIQMTVNRNTKSLEEVEADIDEIQEDVEDLEEEIDDISEDLEEIQEDDEKESKEDAQARIALEKIESGLQRLLNEVDSLKKTNAKNP